MSLEDKIASARFIAAADALVAELTKERDTAIARAAVEVHKDISEREGKR